MSFTHTYTLSCSPSGGVPLTSTYPVTSGAEVNISEVIPGASADLVVACTLKVSKMQSLYLYCADRDMTVKTNSGVSPAATVNLKAGKALVWEATTGQANPFAAVDVTALYVTLAAGANATFEMRCVVDPT